MRWFLVILLALLVFNGLQPWLQRIGLGRLPGDFRFRFAGREWFIPLTSSIVLSLIAYAIGMLV
jgi:hypothetical protein